MPPTALRSLSPLAVTLALVVTARAQCTYAWPAAAFAGGADDSVRALTVDASGNLIAGGRFANVGTTAASRIARWNNGWQPLGLGVDGDVTALAVGPFSGFLFVGGTFANADGQPASMIARWDGNTWTALGTGITPIVPFGGSVQAIAAAANGDVFVGGAFAQAGGVNTANIARWDGSAWSALGTGCNGTVRGLAFAPNGDLYATGSFVAAGGVVCNGIARWNGAAWSALGSGLGVFGGTAVAVAPNGDVFVGGSFVTAGGGNASHIARWNGAAWSPLGAGVDTVVTSLLALPNGHVVAGGLFANAGGAPASRIARWDGSAWSAFGTGVDAAVLALALDPQGAVAVAGDFTTAGGAPAARLARITSSCGPTAAVVGSGCTGSGGPNVLSAMQLPVLGGTFRAIGIGMPAFGFVLTVTGLSSTSLPLSAALPQALPGCTLHANPDFVDVALPALGAAITTLSFPNDPVLPGIAFWHQYVPMELDASFAVTAFTATNALQVTIGTF